MTFPRTRTSLAAALVAAGFGGSATLAQAQSEQRVEITGSNIKRIESETASPVQILSRDDIERTGKQSIQEVLRGITADGQGSIPSSFTNGFASGSAAVSLRGLGVNSTLVLVNGRRMSTYGLADDGTRNFVDLNSLPLEAVDRIEVLKDGASAIYGADAVGGVVNVILRKNYVGKSVGGSYGMSGHSDGQTTRVHGSVGVGDLDTDRFNVFMTLEASHQENIWSTSRGYIGKTDLTQFGFYDTTNGLPRPWFGVGPTANSPYGVVRDADNNRVNVIPCATSAMLPNGLCGYNGRVEQEVQPQIDRLNVFGRATLQFSPSLTAYTEIGYFNTKTESNGTLGANNDGGVYKPGDPFDPLVVHGLMSLPATHPDNPVGIDTTLGLLPMELGGRDQKTNNQVLRLVQGFQGTAWGWDFDFGAAYMKSRLKNYNYGYIIADVMQEAITNGTYRITSPSLTDPSVLAAISPTLRNTPTSTVKLLDFKASRDIATLPGGPLSVALGGEMRWENADTPPVPYTDTGAIIGLGYSAFEASRRAEALFGEVNLPVAKWLDLDGALRYDHYSDFGSSTTPKFGFMLKPMNQLALRGTYAESFRAPGPAERGGSSFGFTTVGILSQGNPNIKPEEAKSYTLGLVLEPLRGTSATIDYWRIKREKEIIQADPATIIPEGAPLTADPLTKIPGALPGTFVYYDSNGELATVTGFYENASSTKTDGVDVELRQRLNMGSAGRLTAQLNWTHVNKFKRTDAHGNTFDYAGTHGPIVLSAGAGTPKDKATLSVTWDRSPWTLTGAINYVGGLQLKDHKGETATDNGDGTVMDDSNGILYPAGTDLNCAVFKTDGSPARGNCKLPSFTTVDVFGKWTVLKNLDINFSVQNLFDKKAPFDPYLVLTYGINYNQTWHQAGAVGRFFTLAAKYSF